MKSFNINWGRNFSNILFGKRIEFCETSGFLRRPQKSDVTFEHYLDTVKLGDKELFGHPKIVPECQKFLIANNEPNYYIKYT